MAPHQHRISLLDDDGDGFDISVMTPKGAFSLRGAISDDDGAFVLFIDTNENEPALEPTADRLRVNVNDGPVFNYADAVNWYGQDQGRRAPVLGDDDTDDGPESTTEATQPPGWRVAAMHRALGLTS